MYPFVFVGVIRDRKRNHFLTFPNRRKGFFNFPYETLKKAEEDVLRLCSLCNGFRWLLRNVLTFRWHPVTVNIYFILGSLKVNQLEALVDYLKEHYTNRYVLIGYQNAGSNTLTVSWFLSGLMINMLRTLSWSFRCCCLNLQINLFTYRVHWGSVRQMIWAILKMTFSESRTRNQILGNDQDSIFDLHCRTNILFCRSFFQPPIKNFSFPTFPPKTLWNIESPLVTEGWR